MLIFSTKVSDIKSDEKYVNKDIHIFFKYSFLAFLKISLVNKITNVNTKEKINE